MTQRFIDVRMTDVQILERAAQIIERDGLGAGRYPTDRCTCGHQRFEHLGRTTGCVGALTYDCECKRFTLDLSELSGEHRRVLAFLRTLAERVAA